MDGAKIGEKDLLLSFDAIAAAITDRRPNRALGAYRLPALVAAQVRLDVGVVDTMERFGHALNSGELVQGGGT
jgi:hypothetical protein